MTAKRLDPRVRAGALALRQLRVMHDALASMEERLDKLRDEIGKQWLAIDNAIRECERIVREKDA